MGMADGGVGPDIGGSVGVGGGAQRRRLYAKPTPKLSPSPPPAQELPSEQILKDLAQQRECVKTPAEFVAAFAKRENRCVDPDLIGRTASGDTVAKAALDVSYKAAFFWSGNDALQKYMRIGFPLTIGDYTIDQSQNYSTPTFAGVQEMSNGQALLENIGWPGNYANISKVYSLNIVSRRALRELIYSKEHNDVYRQYFRANVLPIRPTWSNVRDYFEYIYSDINLQIPDEVVQMLNDLTDEQLIGCPAQCAYANAYFPGSGPLSVPISIYDRNATTGACPTREEVKSAYGTDVTLMSPTAVVESGPLCVGITIDNKVYDWNSKYAAMKAATAEPNGFCSYPSLKSAGVFLKQKIDESAGDVPAQAQWFRAYLMQSCPGAFNTLFAGNGITFTGTGGLLSPTSSEYIASPFNMSSLPESAKASISFCVNGLNGGKPTADGICPSHNTNSNSV